MTDAVDQALRRWRSTPFVYGHSDCMLSVADYIADIGGKDVTGLFRGTYDTEEGARATIETHGGVAGLADLAGLEPWFDEPERGDMVAVEFDAGIIAGICTGGLLAFRLERGVGEIRCNLVRVEGVWRCPR